MRRVIFCRFWGQPRAVISRIFIPARRSRFKPERVRSIGNFRGRRKTRAAGSLNSFDERTKKRRSLVRSCERNWPVYGEVGMCICTAGVCNYQLLGSCEWTGADFNQSGRVYVTRAARVFYEVETRVKYPPWGYFLRIDSTRSVGVDEETSGDCQSNRLVRRYRRAWDFLNEIQDEGRGGVTRGNGRRVLCDGEFSICSFLIKSNLINW